MARRNPRNYDLAFAIRNTIIRSIERDHDRAHLRMNIAKDERDSRPVETNIASSSSLVETQVKPFAFEKRKHIVKKRIAIGKLDHCPDWDHQQVGLEAFVVLH